MGTRRELPRRGGSDCGYSLEPPRRGGSNEYPQSMFLSRNKENYVYPCKPQFYHIKVGFKGVKIIQACFRNDYLNRAQHFVQNFMCAQRLSDCAFAQFDQGIRRIILGIQGNDASSGGQRRL